MKKRALITGINGFLGRHLKDSLQEQGIQVIGIGRSVKEKEHIYKVDLTDKQSLKEIIMATKPDYIFHTAGVIFSNQIEDYYQSNVIGTINLLESITTQSHYRPSILSIGTSAEYGIIDPGDLPITEEHPEQPYNDYGLSKLAQTKACLDYGLRHNLHINVVRLFNLLGRGLSTGLAIGSFIQQVKIAQRGDTIRVGNLQAYRDYMDVKDVTNILCSVIKLPVNHQVVNVCSGQPVQIGEILQRIIQISGKALVIKQMPSKLKKTDIPIHYGSNKKVTQLLGQLHLTPMEKSLESMMKDLDRDAKGDIG